MGQATKVVYGIAYDILRVAAPNGVNWGLHCNGHAGIVMLSVGKFKFPFAKVTIKDDGDFLIGHVMRKDSYQYPKFFTNDIIEKIHTLVAKEDKFDRE